MAIAAISPIVLAAVTVPLALLWFLISPHLSWSRKITGPWLAKYTRLWYLWQIQKADFHRTNVELHRQRGKFLERYLSFNIQIPFHYQEISRLIPSRCMISNRYLL